MNNLLLISIDAGFIGLLIGILLTRATLQEIERIRRTPTGMISSLPSEGQVEVLGRAGQGSAHSPLTHTACVFWQVQVEEWRSAGRSSYWATIFKDASEQAFEVSDASGSVRVLPSGAEFILRDEVNESSSLINPLDPQIQQAVEGLGLTTTGWLGLERSLRVHERLIQADEALYVLGEIRLENDIRTIGSNASAPLVLSDRSERATLLALYGRVAARIVPLSLFVILLAWTFFLGRR